MEQRPTSSGRWRRPPRPTSRNNFRLVPITGNLGSAVGVDHGDGQQGAVDQRRPSLVGHMGVLQGLRRSEPHAAAVGSNGEVGRGRSSSDTADEAEPRLPWAAPPNVRVRRSSSRRRAADISSLGASASTQSSGGIRSHSCAVRGTESLDVATSNGESAPCAGTERVAPARCGSVPPVGTAKADQVVAERTKAHAVAALQRLFFEEMSKARERTGEDDANAAAARALRRLTEAPFANEETCSGSVVVGCQPQTQNARNVVPVAPPPRQAGVPHRPSPAIGGRRQRPTMQRIAVQS
eukprot:TRINITY_DN34098_c0_g1_i1.p1 TRINITY_DN34098_c0_g1~~TRINITY_DN34098_c0_g1_i1.p1  ORF type:complete len:295 (-),score=38.54 TRINITY_DN34098_c0_g1_i1:283-1167(-)